MESIKFNAFTGVNEVMPANLIKYNQLSEAVNAGFHEKGAAGEAVMRGCVRDTSLVLPSEIRSAAVFNENTPEQQLFFQCNDGVYILSGLAGTPVKVINSAAGAPESLIINAGESSYLYVNKEDKPLYIKSGTPHEVTEFIPEAPDIAGVTYTVESSGGNLGAGYYRYLMVYVTAEDEKSGISQPIDIHGSAAGGVTAGSGVKLFGLPVPSDTIIKSKIIYRTEALGNTDSFILFYKRAVLSADETTFYDTGEESGDEYLDFGETAEIKTRPQAGCCIKAHGRLFFGNVKIQVVNPFAPGITSNTDPAKRFRAWQDAITGGNLLSENFYRWRIVFVDENGTESLTVDTPEFLTSAGTGKNSADLQLVPFTGSGANALPVVKRRLYRTKGYLTPGEPGPFYLHTDNIGFPGNSLRDTKGDDELGAEYENALRFEDKPGLILFSGYSRQREFSPEDSFIAGSDDEGEIIHLSEFQGGINIVKEKAVYRLFTEGNPAGWRLIKGADGLNVIQKKSVTEVGGSVYFTTQKGIYCYDGNLKELSLNLYKSKQLTGSLSGAVINMEKELYSVAVSDLTKTTVINSMIRTGDGFIYEYPAELTPVINSGSLLHHGSVVSELIEDGFTDYINSADTGITAILTTAEFTAPYNFRPRYFEAETEGADGGLLELRVEDQSGEYMSGTVAIIHSGPGITKIRRSQLTEGSLHTGRNLKLQLTFSGVRKVKSVTMYYDKINRGRMR